MQSNTSFWFHMCISPLMFWANIIAFLQSLDKLVAWISGDTGYGEGVKRYFKCVFHVFIARTRDHENRRERRIAQARLRTTRRLFA